MRFAIHDEIFRKYRYDYNKVYPWFSLTFISWLLFVNRYLNYTFLLQTIYPSHLLPTRLSVMSFSKPSCSSLIQPPIIIQQLIILSDSISCLVSQVFNNFNLFISKFSPLVILIESCFHYLNQSNHMVQLMWVTSNFPHKYTL